MALHMLDTESVVRVDNDGITHIDCGRGNLGLPGSFDTHPQSTGPTTTSTLSFK